MDFERAALLHKKLDKLGDSLRAQPELPRRLQDLNAVILQRAVAQQCVCVYEVRNGKITDPFELSFGALAGDPRSAEQVFRQHLEPNHSMIPGSPVIASESASSENSGVNSGREPRNSVTPSAASESSDFDGRNLPSFERRLQGDLSEHLCLLARWFYSNPRQGEIFFAQGPSRFSHPAPAVSRNADDEAGMQTPHQAKDFGERDWPYRRIIRACSRLLVTNNFLERGFALDLVQPGANRIGNWMIVPPG